MILDLHHATDDKGAHGIEQDQEFRFGSFGYAGPGIYFAANRKNAVAHAFNGKRKLVTVVISCRVNLGKCLEAQPNVMTEAKCVAKGCDSVNIRGTDTYAVYDPARVTILGFKSMRFKDIGLKPSMKVLVAVETFVAAIKASPEHCLNALDLGQLYLRHPGLREAMGSKLKPFCEAHTELTWIAHGVTLSVRSPSSPASSTSGSDLENELSCPRSTPSGILVAAIQASPTGSLNVTSDMRPLYLNHPSLRDALRAYGGLQGFCEAHPGLQREGELLSLSPLGMIVAAIQASPGGFLQHMGPVYSNYPGLREAIGSNGLRLFCEAHSELEWEVNKVTLAKQFQFSQYERRLEVARQQFQKDKMKHEQDAKPSSSTDSSTAASDSENECVASESALELLLAAIGASPYGSPDAVADMRSLYLKHPTLRNYICESGGLKAFCEAHAELSWLNGSVKLCKQKKQEESKARQHRDAARQLQMQREKAAADEERQCRKEKAVLEEKQALVKRLQLQREEDEARRQQALAREFIEQHEARKEREYYEARRQRSAQELQLKRDAERQMLLEKDQKARLQRQEAQRRELIAEEQKARVQRQEAARRDFLEQDQRARLQRQEQRRREQLKREEEAQCSLQ